MPTSTRSSSEAQDSRPVPISPVNSSVSRVTRDGIRAYDAAPPGSAPVVSSMSSRTWDAAAVGVVEPPVGEHHPLAWRPLPTARRAELADRGTARSGSSSASSSSSVARESTRASRWRSSPPARKPLRYHVTCLRNSLQPRSSPMCSRQQLGVATHHRRHLAEDRGGWRRPRRGRRRPGRGTATAARGSRGRRPRPRRRSPRPSAARRTPPRCRRCRGPGCRRARPAAAMASQSASPE